ncbi:MAG: hypothetical protein QOE92_405 [Chloroflexota bacterium]|jgi:plastocyanin|nr:hypothetical protein [Chloroflexota bacterium]
MNHHASARPGRALATILLAVLGAAAMLLSLPSTASAGGGCHYAKPSSATGTTVEIRNYCFAPNTLHIQPGDTVTWVNRDEDSHTVTGTAMSFGDFNTLGTGKTVSYRFTVNGVYPYFCELHPAMAAAIVVGDGSGVGPATADSVVPAVAANGSLGTPVPTQAAAARTESSPWPWAALGPAGLVFGGAAATLVARRRGRRVS